MHSNKQIDPQAQPAQGPGAKASISRRSLLRASVGSAPVALTFVSQPVRATANLTCTTASAYASVTANPATSSKVVAQTCTQAAAPNWWTNPANSSKWPSSCGTQSVPHLFSACVGTCKGAVASNQTLKDCMNSTSSDAVAVLAKHLAAHYCNVQSNRLTWLSTNTLTAIWNSFNAGGGGSYNPTGLVNMDIGTVCNWLSNNYGPSPV